MLIIRDEQLRALGRIGTVEKIVRVLSESQPDASLDELRARISPAVDWALDVLELSTEAGVADYAGLVFELGSRFEEDEAVAAILARRGQSAEQRWRAVFDELGDADWARLRANATGG